MRDNGILEWSFTRTHEIGDGPPPTEDETTIVYDESNDRVIAGGVYRSGHTGWEGCVRQMRYDRRDDVLTVAVGSVRVVRDDEEERLVHDVEQRVQYEVAVEFAAGLPARTELRHLDVQNEVQYSMTA